MEKTVGEPSARGFGDRRCRSRGFFSTLNEGLANAPALAEAKMNPSADELIKAVTEDLMTSEGCANAHEGIKDRALAELRQAATIVNAKAPADAAAFKAWLSHIAQVVAEARSEGGALGFGSAQVSDKEKVTLAEIIKTFEADRRCAVSANRDSHGFRSGLKYQFAIRSHLGRQD